MAWARQNLAWISFTEGRMAEAEERLLAASEAFERAGDLAGRGWSSGLLAYVRIYDGRFAEADELARQTLLDAREQGDQARAAKASGAFQYMLHRVFPLIVTVEISAIWTRA